MEVLMPQDETDFGDRQAQKLAEPVAYLPLSSLAAPNPTLPSPDVSLLFLLSLVPLTHRVQDYGNRTVTDP
jgi:hypothetical protein